MYAENAHQKGQNDWRWLTCRVFSHNMRQRFCNEEFSFTIGVEEDIKIKFIQLLGII